MILHPEAQIKAQKEVDSVVGPDRLPDFSDKEDLPYVNAIIMEVLRIFPILPLGVPHLNIVEDEYKALRIPKGSPIFPNAWLVVPSSHSIQAQTIIIIGPWFGTKMCTALMLMISVLNVSLNLSCVILERLSLASDAGEPTDQITLD